MKTFDVSWVLGKLAEQEGLNLETDGIDDVCFGMVVSSDKSFVQILRENSGPYNFQIIDGDPIRLVRRAVNDGLIIDYTINEADCIRRGNSPAISFSRIEPSSLPRQVEIQYIDPDRDYAMNTQQARHTAAPTTNTQLSVALDFVISSQQARDMAFDLLYRMWAQQLSINFEHRDLSIEPGDTIQLSTSQGTFICLVGNQTINMPSRTNSISANILLSTKATTVVPAPQADGFIPNESDEWSGWIAAA